VAALGESLGWLFVVASAQPRDAKLDAIADQLGHASRHDAHLRPHRGQDAREPSKVPGGDVAVQFPFLLPHLTNGTQVLVVRGQKALYNMASSSKILSGLNRPPIQEVSYPVYKVKVGQFVSD